MVAGLQVFRADGSLQLDITDRITRFLGTFSTGTVNGQFVDARLLQGKPFFQVVNGMFVNVQYSAADIAVGTDRFTWTFGQYGFTTERLNSTVIYGVY